MVSLIPRGTARPAALTGAVIASLLAYLEVVVLPGPLGVPLLRLAFPVHVAVKTKISATDA
jgi:hypothetical protein